MLLWQGGRSIREGHELQERDLSGCDPVGLFLGGKTFGDDAMLIALGITIKGEEVVLGFVQTATEDERVCSQFLRSLVDRGLNVEQGRAVCNRRCEGAA